LRSSEGDLFEVNDAFNSISETIKQAMEDNGNEDAVSLPEVDSRTLSKVIEYCNKHWVEQDDHTPDSEDVEKFDSEFVRVEHQTLFTLFRAANYLKIERLAYLIGKMMMGKTVSGLLFNINDAGCRNDTTL
jgi:S-phase kinase-associated protein 1